MIFVALMLLAATTIITSSVDMSRMARLKLGSLERDAKWNLCLDSAKALIVEALAKTGSTTQNLSTTLNGIPLNIQSRSTSSWGNGQGCQITVTGTQDGQSRTATLYVGERVTVNPAQFACMVTTQLKPGSQGTLKCRGDLYCPVSTTGTGIDARSDVYSPLPASPSFSNLDGHFIGRQPKPAISLSNSKYAAVASTTSSGTITLNSPSGPTSWGNSKVYYHTGNLTISGTVTGRVTVYVAGNVVLSNPSLSTSNGSHRLVVIANGNVTIRSGDSDANVIASGTVTVSGTANLNGSLACGTLSGLTSNLTINYDGYFEYWSFESDNFRIPGQW